ncbi:MAG: DNA-binding protein [Bacteroidaceae bacterium]|nr:DNA-binding protein [Bacteroidaceae bacterium]
MSKEEAAIKKFALRVDSQTMKAIEKWAADEFRSTNGQLQWILSDALRRYGRSEKKSLPSTTKKEGPLSGADSC